MEHTDLKAILQGMRLLLPLATILSHLVLMPAADAISNMPSPISVPRPGCPSKCGNVNIPYPFGIGNDCAWRGSDNFTVTCDHSYSSPRPYFTVYNQSYQIINISVETGEIRIFSSFASICFDSYDTTYFLDGLSLNYTKSPFLISPTRNQFTAIGGNTLAFMEGREDFTYYTGCVTSSVNLDGAARDGDECTGLGCCQTTVAGNLSYVHIYWTNTQVQTPINRAWRQSPCGYAFLAEKGWYKFSRRDLVRDGSDTFATRVGKHSISVVLDWAIRNGSCQSASACVSSHSYCVNATQGPGYLCNCKKGYAGNPYVIGPDGCTNTDECTRLTEFPCLGVCKDTDGSYECNCPAGEESDGDPKEKPCHPKLSSSAKLIIGTTVGASVLFFIILGTGVCYMLKRIEQKAKERELEAIERKNGSERLKNVKTLILFTKDELDKITKNNSVPLGKGGFGEVHKGTLSDKTEVAVKASNEVTQGTLDKFVEEVEIQSRMMHRNILKLLGCCLRVDVPLLVYEYAAKGSLKVILHGKNNDQPREPLTLRSRLDIAIGSAQRLAHMHSYTENGIQHADVKPDNILLDGGLVPKISDFGLSKVSVAGKDYTMNVIGCLPYMDPVYKDTGRLTPKSDVYSFGIVLLELISRRPVVDGEHSLVKQFKSVFEKDNTGKVLFDKDIAEEQDIPILDEIAKLAIKCLKENVNERPAMASVASALVILKDSWEETRQRISSTSIN